MTGNGNSDATKTSVIVIKQGYGHFVWLAGHWRCALIFLPSRNPRTPMEQVALQEGRGSDVMWSWKIRGVIYYGIDRPNVKQCYRLTLRTDGGLKRQNQTACKFLFLFFGPTKSMRSYPAEFCINKIVDNVIVQSYLTNLAVFAGLVLVRERKCTNVAGCR